MYEGYQSLLDGLSEKAGWTESRLSVGEDITYGNMVACPSARWTTTPLSQGQNDVTVPPMTIAERNGIVAECFRKRSYFLRQLYQSLPAVLIVFSQSTANALIGELHGRFSIGEPKPEEPIEELAKREIRLGYGSLASGGCLDARVLFSPHVTGDPDGFAAAKATLVSQLAEEVQRNNLTLNPQTKHLARTRGSCVFCTHLNIGPCDYADELKLLTAEERFDQPTPSVLATEKRAQQTLMVRALTPAHSVDAIWAKTDDNSLVQLFSSFIVVLSFIRRTIEPDKKIRSR